MKLNIVAVICIDGEDFLEWKKQQGHSSTGFINAKRKYQIDNNIYYAISKPCDLCSLSVDRIEETHDAYKNPDYIEIRHIIEANLNPQTPEIRKITLNTLKQKKLSDVKYIGIIKAKEWFKQDGLSFIFPNDYVVCEWCDYHDGVNSHIEGKTTIGIVKTLDDAEILYNHRSLDTEKFPSQKEIDDMADKYTSGEIYVYAGIAMVKTWLKEHGLL